MALNTEGPNTEWKEQLFICVVALSEVSFYSKIPPVTLFTFFGSFLSFSDTLACLKEEKKKSQKSFGGKALCDTVNVTQINQIKELQHSTAESHIIIHAQKTAGLQCCNTKSSAAS